MENQIELTVEQFMAMLGNNHKFFSDTKYYKITDEIYFDEDILSNLLSIDKSETYTLEVMNCEFQNKLIFADIKGFHIKCIFMKCTFHGNVDVVRIKADYLLFLDCTLKNIGILECSMNAFNLTKTNIELLTVSSNRNFFIDVISLDDVKGEFVGLSGTDFGSLNISNLECKEDFSLRFQSDTLENGTQEKIENLFDLININNLNLTMGRNSTSFNLFHLKIYEFVLTGIAKNISFMLNDAVIHLFYITDFVNDGKVRLHDITIENGGSGSITDSQLGKMEFSSVNLNAAISFNIYLSNLTEIITTNTSFPKKIHGRSLDDYWETKEVYRQLKFAASKQGDRIKELEYEKYEMINYEKTLHGWGSWKDKLILWSNRLTNNHGQDYTITLFLWFIPLTLFIFSLIKINLGYSFILGIPRANDVSQYLESALNPLHDFNKVFNDSLVESVGKARLCDSILKLVSGYLIFQFLRAFRKFVK